MVSPEHDSATSTTAVGACAEDIAERYLQQQGLRIECRNYRWPGGEIDLVMRDERTLVFVEVRYRAADGMSSPEASINAAKRRRLVITAEHYLARHPTVEYEAIRFDVMALTGPLRKPNVRWLRGAFTADAG